MFGIRKRNPEYGDVYFYDPLLKMNYAGRFFVRIAMSSWAIVHIVVTIVLLLTDIQWVFWLGVINMLYLLDRLFHYSKSEVNFPGSEDVEGNLLLYLSPGARRALVSAYSKAAVLGGGFYLNLARVLSENKSVIEMLKRLEVGEKEFNSKLDGYLARDLVSYRDKERLLGEVERLVYSAAEATDDAKNSIDVSDLFVALSSVEDERAYSLFRVFEISPSSLADVALFGDLAGRPSFLIRKDMNIETSYKRAIVYAVLDIEKKNSVYVPYYPILLAIRLAENYSPDRDILLLAMEVIRDSARYVSEFGDGIVRGDDIIAAAERVKTKPKAN